MERLTAKIERKEQLISNVILLSFDVDLEFKAGQFITLTMEKEGIKKPRSYSILNPPSEKGLKLCIKLVEGGFASSIFKDIKEGDSLEIKGPFGHFVFNEEDENKEIWFIGNGTGIIPFYSMLKEHLTKHSNKKFVLLISFKNKEDLLFDQELRKLEKNNPNFQYIPTLTQENWKGKKGRVQHHLPEKLQNKTFYICGVKELVIDTKDLLSAGGVEAKNIKFERFT